jgi:hypothetical protein
MIQCVMVVVEVIVLEEQHSHTAQCQQQQAAGALESLSGQVHCHCYPHACHLHEWPGQSCHVPDQGMCTSVTLRSKHRRSPFRAPVAPHYNPCLTHSRNPCQDCHVTQSLTEHPLGDLRPMARRVGVHGADHGAQLHACAHARECRCKSCQPIATEQIAIVCRCVLFNRRD